MKISMHGDRFVKPEGRRAVKHPTRQTGSSLFFSLNSTGSQDVGADEQHILLDLKRNLLIGRIRVP